MDGDRVLSIPGGGVGLVLVPVAMAGGTWFYIGGVFRVVARAQGESVSAWYFGQALRPWASLRDRRNRGWWRLVMPNYFRRASRVLGWSERFVLGGLLLLLAIDIGVAVRLFTQVPSS